MRQLRLWSNDEVRQEVLPTNLTTRNHAVHRWFNITAGFSPEYVRSCISRAELSSNARLIDPFAGLSTSLVEASIQGLHAIGFEPHPLFFDLSSAKLNPPTDTNEIGAIQCALLEASSVTDLASVWAPGAEAFLRKLIPESELRRLAAAVDLEGRLFGRRHPLYRLIVSRVLELAASSQTDGIYKAPTTSKVSVPYENAVIAVCKEVAEDLLIIDEEFASRTTLYPHSAETMAVVPEESCDLCVTSPPYLNNFDYAEMTRMELYFWRYANSWGEITERVRRQLVVNTTTAPTDLKNNQDYFASHLSPATIALLLPIIDELRNKAKQHKGKKDYWKLVIPYFAQMASVIRELRRVLRRGAPLHLVVADAALYGVHIRTDELLASLMVEAGFSRVGIVRLRHRGTRWILDKRQGASDGLGEFEITAIA